jgi:hypothetical protein
VTPSRLIVWLAFSCAVVCAGIVLYFAISHGWAWGAGTAAIGFTSISLSAWAFSRGWVLVAVGVPLIPVAFISTAANPGAVFLLPTLLILIAAVVRLFELKGAKLRANGGRA